MCQFGPVLGLSYNLRTFLHSLDVSTASLMLEHVLFKLDLCLLNIPLDIKVVFPCFHRFALSFFEEGPRTLTNVQLAACLFCIQPGEGVQWLDQVPDHVAGHFLHLHCEVLNAIFDAFERK